MELGSGPPQGRVRGHQYRTRPVRGHTLLKREGNRPEFSKYLPLSGNGSVGGFLFLCSVLLSFPSPVSTICTIAETEKSRVESVRPSWVNPVGARA